MTWWGLWCPGRWGFTSEGPWEPVRGDGVWAGDWTVEGGLRVSKRPGEEDGLSRPVYRGRVWRTEVRGDLQADLDSQIRNKSSEFRFCDSYNTHTHTHTHTHTQSRGLWDRTIHSKDSGIYWTSNLTSLCRNMGPERSSWWRWCEDWKTCRTRPAFTSSHQFLIIILNALHVYTIYVF